jgi:chromosome segregation ATPase
MNDTVTMERISELEGRLAVALDRISSGVGTLKSQSGAGGGDIEAAAAALAEAETRAAELAARLADAEGDGGSALAEAQEALDAEQSANAALTEQLRALEASRQASQDEAARLTAAHEEKMAELTGELTESRAANEELRAQIAERDAAPAVAEPDPEDKATIERLEGEVEILRRRVKRLRGEAATAREQRDEAQDILDELRSGDGDGATEAALRVELRELRLANAELRDTSQEMRQIAAQGETVDPDLLNASMAAELVALKAERAAEAAEMQQIVDELTPLVSGDSANA